MSDVIIRNFNVPANCMECEWRDADACGECELMIGNPFPTFEEQFAHCPFHVIAKRHPLVPVQPHGRLIDADALADVFRGFIAMYDSCPFSQLSLPDKARRDELQSALAEVINAPTIVPADKADDYDAINARNMMWEEGET